MHVRVQRLDPELPLFTEPAGGTTVAVTKKLIELGRIPRDESIVICVTGNGYKTIEAVQDALLSAQARLTEADATVFRAQDADQYDAGRARRWAKAVGAVPAK